MEFKDIVATRRSIRKFSDRKVEQDILKSVVDAAISAPSSRNCHSTSFLVVTRPELLKKIATMRDYGSAFVKNAPAAILVMGDRTKTDLVQVNSSISATTLLMAATDAGLSACWVHVEGRPQLKDEPNGAQAIDLLREILPIPEECDVLCAIAIGYSDFEPAPLPEFDRSDMIKFVE
ncbi:MAG: nitroreductase family protein [Rikenellaceae bacterium]